jgi:hypothetical protein
MGLQSLVMRYVHTANDNLVTGAEAMDVIAVANSHYLLLPC